MLAGQPSLAVFAAESADELREQLDAPEHTSPTDGARVRAAVVASAPDDVGRGVEQIRSWLDEPARPVRARRGAFLATGEQPARIGFLFPGQGAPVHAGAGGLGDRFPEAAAVYRDSELPADDVPDELVQLAVVTSSLAALRATAALGLAAELAVGHSLGELTALHWAGALDEAALLRTVRARGHAMVAHTGDDGAMASLIADEETVGRVVEGIDVSLACRNSPRQFVVSGRDERVAEAVARARALGVRAMPLRVTGAFHSPLMEDAVRVFDEHLAGETIGQVERTVFSTITGAQLARETDLRELLLRQLLDPVRFVDAVQTAAPAVDLFVEVGPGKALAGLVAETVEVPVVSIRSGERAGRGALELVAAAYVAGVPGALDGAARRAEVNV